jgi:hypothetical protein
MYRDQPRLIPTHGTIPLPPACRARFFLGLRVPTWCTRLARASPRSIVISCTFTSPAGLPAPPSGARRTGDLGRMPSVPQRHSLLAAFCGKAPNPNKHNETPTGRSLSCGALRDRARSPPIHGNDARDQPPAADRRAAAWWTQAGGRVRRKREAFSVAHHRTNSATSSVPAPTVEPTAVSVTTRERPSPVGCEGRVVNPTPVASTKQIYRETQTCKMHLPRARRNIQATLKGSQEGGSICQQRGERGRARRAKRGGRRTSAEGQASPNAKRLELPAGGQPGARSHPASGLTTSQTWLRRPSPAAASWLPLSR